MVTDIKNIAFKYVKVSGVASTIDVTMDDARFYKNKPIGYYKCFIFPENYYAGYDYKDLVNFVSIEEKEMWDRTNRDTFLGYNEETNEFICNINAYMGLKDTDLKTDGELPHSGQAAWHLMSLTSTASDGIIKIKQTDNTDIYLKIKPVVAQGQYLSGIACAESTKKKVAGATILYKGNQASWVKSPEDNSVIMVRDNAPNVSYLSVDKKFIYKDSYYVQNCIYGKPVINFIDTGSSTTIFPLGFATDSWIKNNSGNGKDFIELTETSDLNDILNSGESLAFIHSPKQKSFWCSKDLSTGVGVKNKIWFNELPQLAYRENNTMDIESYSTPKIKGITCDLVSSDMNKPFVYVSEEGNFQISPSVFYPKSYIANLQDGFIACFNLKNKIYRFKKGDPVKYKSSRNGSTVVISGTTYVNNIYIYNGSEITKETISKSDLVNATGFTDVPDNHKTTSTYTLFSVTIMKV